MCELKNCTYEFFNLGFVVSVSGFELKTVVFSLPKKPDTRKTEKYLQKIDGFLTYPQRADNED